MHEEKAVDIMYNENTRLQSKYIEYGGLDRAVFQSASHELPSLRSPLKVYIKPRCSLGVCDALVVILGIVGFEVAERTRSNAFHFERDIETHLAVSAHSMLFEVFYFHTLRLSTSVTTHTSVTDHVITS